jgi:hypothetical protein
MGSSWKLLTWLTDLSEPSPIMDMACLILGSSLFRKGENGVWLSFRIIKELESFALPLVSVTAFKEPLGRSELGLGPSHRLVLLTSFYKGLLKCSGSGLSGL